MQLTDAAPLALPDGLREALQSAYSTPGRAYHNLDHVEEVLGHYAGVAQDLGWQQPVEVFLALLLHDAVYEPGRKDNEARSAALAKQWLGQWFDPAAVDVARVAALVELTARHGRLDPADVDRDAALFLDCDMAILGAPAPRFDRYDQAIAAEYRGKLPAWMFRHLRRRFLRHLLQQPRIFLSEYFHQRLDAAARANLKRALALPRSALQAGAGR